MAVKRYVPTGGGVPTNVLLGPVLATIDDLNALRHILAKADSLRESDVRIYCHKTSIEIDTFEDLKALKPIERADVLLVARSCRVTLSLHGGSEVFGAPATCFAIREWAANRRTRRVSPERIRKNRRLLAVLILSLTIPMIYLALQPTNSGYPLLKQFGAMFIFLALALVATMLNNLRDHDQTIIVPKSLSEYENERQERRHRRATLGATAGAAILAAAVAIAAAILKR
ncbi:hypothetical protein [Amycolatopsis magusensis]|uniref:hypothetical protein n=1 Tax=Amycolatopsis magusensis TaxID=882444 RepID=UPI0037B28E3D